MRRFLTIASLALTTLASAPVLAAGPGGGYAGNRGSDHSASAPAPAYHPEATRPGSNDGYRGDRRGDHDRDVGISRAEMKKAQALELRYTRDMKAAKKALATAEAKLAKLMRTRHPRASQILAAQRRVNAAEQKLVSLTRTYHLALARFLSPVQVRFFLSLS